MAMKREDFERLCEAIANVLDDQGLIETKTVEFEEEKDVFISNIELGAVGTFFIDGYILDFATTTRSKITLEEGNYLDIFIHSGNANPGQTVGRLMANVTRVKKNQ